MQLRSIHRDRRLVPKFNDNQALPVEEQVVVEFGTLPSAVDADQYTEFVFGPTGRVETIRYRDAEILRRHVAKITNLHDGKAKIETGAQLAASQNPDVLPLIYEIREFVLHQTEGLTPGES